MVKFLDFSLGMLQIFTVAFPPFLTFVQENNMVTNIENCFHVMAIDYICYAIFMGYFIDEFIKAPRVAEVYNIGGGRANSCSIWEAFKIAEKFTGREQVYEYVDENRKGDHICYISNLSKMRAQYPGWDITVSLEETIRQIVEASRAKQH